jgi:dUTP pyrophosphatase
VAVKKGLSVGACVIDEDYQGEIHLHLTNRTQSEMIVNAGDKIIQFVLLPYSKEGITVVPLEELYESTTTRGAGGFGSTGGK